MNRHDAMNGVRLSRSFSRRLATVWFPPRTCDSVAAWASEQGGSCVTEIFPARILDDRSPPRTIEPEVYPKYLERLVVHHRLKYIVPLHAARIMGTSGLIRLPDKSYSIESLYTRDEFNRRFRYRLRHRRRVVRKHGSYFSLIHLWSTTRNYYHWMHDSLKRLYGVLEYMPDDIKFIVPSDLGPVERETLRLLGIDDAQLAQFSGDEIWELDTLFFSTPTSNSGTHWRNADLWLREQILDGYGITPRSAGRRLFISRRGVPRRNLLNEQEVETYLHGLGFETYAVEALPLRAQVELFAEASVIVSTMGASFVNALFSPPGTVIVDMIPPEMLNLGYVYWEMCEELGHEYWYFTADSVPRPDRPNDRYTIVPIDKLAATMARVGVLSA